MQSHRHITLAAIIVFVQVTVLAAATGILGADVSEYAVRSSTIEATGDGDSDDDEYASDLTEDDSGEGWSALDRSMFELDELELGADAALDQLNVDDESADPSPSDAGLVIVDSVGSSMNPDAEAKPVEQITTTITTTTTAPPASSTTAAPAASSTSAVPQTSVTTASTVAPLTEFTTAAGAALGFNPPEHATSTTATTIASTLDSSSTTAAPSTTAATTTTTTTTSSTTTTSVVANVEISLLPSSSTTPTTAPPTTAATTTTTLPTTTATLATTTAAPTTAVPTTSVETVLTTDPPLPVTTWLPVTTSTPLTTWLTSLTMAITSAPTTTSSVVPTTREAATTTQTTIPSTTRPSTTIASTTTTAAPTTTAPSGSNSGLEAMSNNDPRFSQYASVRSDELSVHDLTQPISVPDNGSVGDGQFRAACQYSHFAYDDPIVYPGQPGRSHLHMFFGNTKTDAYSNTDSIVNSGGGTCNGFELNRSAYWTPALLDGRGNAVVPDMIILYYKSKEPHNVQRMPQGLKMVSGNTSAESFTANDYLYWSCGDSGFTYNKSNRIPNCNGDTVNATISFPQCWDGRNMDSANHRSHMALVSPHKPCPSSHPVRLPQISILMYFPGGDTSDWYLSSDRSGGFNTGPGATLHADWWGGWNDEAMDLWTDGCMKAARNCSFGQTGTYRQLAKLNNWQNYPGENFIPLP